MSLMLSGMLLAQETGHEGGGVAGAVVSLLFTVIWLAVVVLVMPGCGISL